MLKKAVSHPGVLHLLLLIYIISGGWNPSSAQFATTLQSQNQAPTQCVAGLGFIPFTSVFYVSGPNTAGDRLVAGPISPSNYSLVTQLALPSAPNQQYCEPVRLGPDTCAIAYVPTAAERAGDFSPFSGLLLDPLYGNIPFPGGIIPVVRIGSIFAWRIQSQVSCSSLSSYRFIPVTPCRAADTRISQGTAGLYGPTLAAGSTRTMPLPASPCGIPASARAYSLNVTVVPQEPLAYLTLWPTGLPRPGVSTLNSFHGGIVANAAIVPAGTGGAIDVFVTNRTDVIVDVNGYFTDAASPQALSFYALDPCRAVDTRYFSEFFGPPSLAAGVARSFPLPNANCRIPAWAAAHSLNATVVPDKVLGYLTLWPTGQSQPFVSTLNSFDGTVVANAAIVPAGPNGAISAFATDRTDLILDTNGFFGAPGNTGERLFRPVAPCRAADTRLELPDGKLYSQETRTFAIAGKCGIPADAKGYSLNVTVVPDGPLAYLTLWPAGNAQPVVSTLNSFLGRIVANAAIVPAGVNGSLNVFVTNPTHVILDVNGYFQDASPALPAPVQLSPPDGSVFGYYPRTTTLHWSTVSGAVRYGVEIDCYHCCVQDRWCSDVGGATQIAEQLAQPTYTFNFVGAQPGRWRVWAVDQLGRKSPVSGWWTFRYTI